MNKIKPVLEGIYNNLELRKRVVPLFLGNPGLAKTTLIKEFFEEKGKKLVSFITSQRNPFEISGMIMPDQQLKKISIWDFDALLELQDGDGLLFDEFGNGNPIVANACLTLLEERTLISGKKLPDIMIMAAANPQGMMPLTPQIKERFVWYDVKFDKSMWIMYMYNKYKLPDSITSKLCSLIKNEEFNGYNFHTPRSLDKAVSMIIKNVPTPYDKEIKPILDTLIKNPLDNDVELPDGTTLGKDESMKGLDWLRLVNLGKITIPESTTTNTVTSSNEILMLDINDNIIGEVRDIETLKTMYYFNAEGIKNIENGIKTPPLSPTPPQSPLFFKKKLK
jgi:hypothetical protein